MHGICDSNVVMIQHARIFSGTSAIETVLMWLKIVRLKKKSSAGLGRAASIEFFKV